MSQKVDPNNCEQLFTALRMEKYLPNFLEEEMEPADILLLPPSQQVSFIPKRGPRIRLIDFLVREHCDDKRVSGYIERSNSMKIPSKNEDKNTFNEKEKATTKIEKTDSKSNCLTKSDVENKENNTKQPLSVPDKNKFPIPPNRSEQLPLSKNNQSALLSSCIRNDLVYTPKENPKESKLIFDEKVNFEKQMNIENKLKINKEKYSSKLYPAKLEVTNHSKKSETLSENKVVFYDQKPFLKSDAKSFSKIIAYEDEYEEPKENDKENCRIKNVYFPGMKMKSSEKDSSEIDEKSIGKSSKELDKNENRLERYKPLQFRGKVDYYNSEKHFGFIKVENSEDSGIPIFADRIYLHASSLLFESGNLVFGEKLKFNIRVIKIPREIKVETHLENRIVFEDQKSSFAELLKEFNQFTAELRKLNEKDSEKVKKKLRTPFIAVNVETLNEISMRKERPFKKKVASIKKDVSVTTSINGVKSVFQKKDKNSKKLKQIKVVKSLYAEVSERNSKNLKEKKES